MKNFQINSKLHIVVTFLILAVIFGCNPDKKTNSKEVVMTVDTLQHTTKLEKFLGKRGQIIIREFYDVGEIKSNTKLSASLTTQALVIYEPGKENEKIKGLKITINAKKYSSYSSYDQEANIFLDLDELESLSSAIKYMEDLAKKWENTDRKYTEVTYVTKGDFNIGFLIQDKKTVKNGQRLWGFVKGGYNDVTCYFSKDLAEQFALIKSNIDSGLKLLKSK